MKKIILMTLLLVAISGIGQAKVIENAVFRLEIDDTTRSCLFDECSWDSKAVNGNVTYRLPSSVNISVGNLGFPILLRDSKNATSKYNQLQFDVETQINYSEQYNFPIYREVCNEIILVHLNASTSNYNNCTITTEYLNLTRIVTKTEWKPLNKLGSIVFQQNVPIKFKIRSSLDRNQTVFGDLTANLKIGPTNHSLNIDPPWWDTSWNQRRGLIITNNNFTSGSGANILLGMGHPLRFTFDTATEISQGQMRSDCQDVRIVYNNLSVLTNVNITACNTSATVFTFNLTNTSISQTNGLFDLYYGKSDATFAWTINLTTTNSTKPFSNNTQRVMLDFNEMVGSNQYDSSGNQINATNTTVIFWNSSGIFDGAVSFDAGADRISLVSDDKRADIEYNRNWTIEWWMWSNDRAGGHFVSKTDVGLIEVECARAGSQVMTCDILGAGSVRLTSNAFLNSQWHHIAVTSNTSADTYNLYIDGRLVDSKANPHSASIQLTNPWRFGSSDRDPGGGAVDTVYDAFRIWNDTMTPSDLYVLKPEPTITIGAEETQAVVPSVIIVGPTPFNKMYVPFRSIYANVTSLAANNVDQCNLEINGTNYTMTKNASSSKNVYCYINQSVANDGPFTFKIFVNDSLNLQNVSTIRNVVIDTVKPNVGFIGPTPNNGTTPNATVVINITTTDQGNASYVDAVILDFNGANETLNFTHEVYQSATTTACADGACRPATISSNSSNVAVFMTTNTSIQIYNSALVFVRHHPTCLIVHGTLTNCGTYTDLALETDNTIWVYASATGTIRHLNLSTDTNITDGFTAITGGKGMFVNGTNIVIGNTTTLVVYDKAGVNVRNIQIIGNSAGADVDGLSMDDNYFYYATDGGTGKTIYRFLINGSFDRIFYSFPASMMTTLVGASKIDPNGDDRKHGFYLADDTGTKLFRIRERTTFESIKSLTVAVNYTYTAFVNDSAGNTNTHNGHVMQNSNPIIQGVTLNVIDFGGATDVRLIINITDVDGLNTISSCTTNGTGAALKSNTTVTNGICPLDMTLAQGLTCIEAPCADTRNGVYGLTATDSSGATSLPYNISFIFTNNSINVTNAFAVNNTKQVVELNNTLTFRDARGMNYTFNYTSVVFSNVYGINNSPVNLTGTISPTTNATLFSNWSADWINDTRFVYNLTPGTLIVKTNENMTGYLETNIQNLANLQWNNAFIDVSSLLPTEWAYNTSADRTYYLNITNITSYRINSTIRNVLVSNITILVADCTDVADFGNFVTHCRYKTGSEYSTRMKFNVTDNMVAQFNVTLEMAIGNFPDWNSGGFTVINNSVNNSINNIMRSENSTTISITVPFNNTAQGSLIKSAYFTRIIYTVPIQAGGGGGSQSGGGGGGGGGTYSYGGCGNNVCDGGETEFSCATDCANLTFFTSPQYWAGQVVKPGERQTFELTIYNPNPYNITVFLDIQELQNQTGHLYANFVDENRLVSQLQVDLPPGSESRPSTLTKSFVVEMPTNVNNGTYAFNILASRGNSQKALSFSWSTSGLNFITPLISPLFPISGPLALLSILTIPAVMFVGGVSVWLIRKK